VLLPICQALLQADAPTMQPALPTQSDTQRQAVQLWPCPLCGGPMVVVERLTAAQIKLRSPPEFYGP
jgi:hypothetical protein